MRTAARSAGTPSAFPNRVACAELDDHPPVQERGVPPIDLIDFTFPVWHTTRDDMSAVSARSIDAVGETIVELLRSGRLR